MFSWQIVWIGMAAFWSQTGHVTSHGRLIQPPQRSSAWRKGYDVPANYNDNELSCGGFGVQWNSQNDGRCGVCGDPFNAEFKPNEDINGTYVKNVITGSYVKGDVLATKVDITAYHKGWFEFRLCPLATSTTKVTQACLNETLLRVAGSNTSRIILADIKNGTGVQVYEINLQLPSTITCERCVLQWKYNTGNSWDCESKGCCVGCGKQENFVNCADIKIADVQTTTGSSSSSSQSATMTALTSSTTLQSSTSSVESSTSTSPTTSTKTTSTSTTSSTPSTTSSASSETTSSTTSSTPSTTSSTSSVATPSTTTETNLESSTSSTNTHTALSSSLSSSQSSSTAATTVAPSSSSTPSTSAVTTSQTTTPESSSSSTNSQTSPSQSSSSSSSATTVSTSASGLSCTGVAPYSSVPGIEAWCIMNCSRGYCPSSHCSCSNS